MLLHISHLAVTHLPTPNSNFWYRLTPTGRLAAVLILLVAIVATPHGHWLTWAVYGGVILGLIGISRISLPQLGRRLAVESGFVGVMLLGTLFHPGGEVLWQWGWLKVTSTGLLILGSVTCKAGLSLLLLNVLTLTTSAPELLQALMTLRIPPLLVAILGAMYRYIAVLQDEFQAIRQAAQARNLTHNPKWQRLVIGNMIGSLFLRTLDRAERVHQAMLSRGYQGLPTRPTGRTLRAFDWSILVSLIIMVMIGQMLNF
jgi:cobalt/nickel transport system permease protein